jgi:mono/diheme cytochrome c family protein
VDRQPSKVVDHRTLYRRLLIFLAVLTIGTAISSDAMVDHEHLGIIEYEVACLSCHGVEGRRPHGEEPKNGTGRSDKDFQSQQRQISREKKNRNHRWTRHRRGAWRTSDASVGAMPDIQLSRSGIDNIIPYLDELRAEQSLPPLQPPTGGGKPTLPSKS